MAVNEVTTDSIKEALRIDGDDDNQLIDDYIKVAKAYVDEAVGNTNDLTEYPQYNMAVSLLVQFWYSNRNIDMKKTPYQVVSMIQQLRGKAWQ